MHKNKQSLKYYFPVNKLLVAFQQTKHLYSVDQEITYLRLNYFTNVYSKTYKSYQDFLACFDLIFMIRCVYIYINKSEI